jgi:hypothetical protein
VRISYAHDEGEGETRQVVGQSAQNVDCRAVRPMQVVNDQNRATAVREPLKRLLRCRDFPQEARSGRNGPFAIEALPQRGRRVQDRRHPSVELAKQGVDRSEWDTAVTRARCRRDKLTIEAQLASALFGKTGLSASGGTG